MPRTLVIDDDPQLQALIGAGGGDEYCFAHSDDEALEILSRDQDIDIALVAIDGDNIGGMGLFRRLKGERLRIPRIALTTGTDLAVIRRAMNEGAVDFLTKPVSIGLRSVGWPDYEVEAVTAARVAGQPDEAIRALVNKLHAQRAERFEALTQTVAHA